MYLLLAVLISLIGVNESAAERGSVDRQLPVLTGVKCIISGQPVNQRFVCDYKSGKLFFDCEASRNRFIKDKTAYITKANHQLVVTKQFVQVRCPVQDKAISLDQKRAIAGVQICFCCDKCQQHFQDGSNTHQQIRYLFGPQNFDTIFQPIAALKLKPSIAK